MTAPTPVNEAEFVAYVAEHENEFVRHYVEALYDERAELMDQRNSILRLGFSDDGRAAMRKVGRVVFFVAIIVVAYLAGRFSN